MARRLPRSFYSRPATEVAPAMLGQTLVRSMPDGARLSGRIVEAEAYMPGDPASHAFRGETPRNMVMFGEPGLLYVYFTYGNHWMMNVVTGEEGEGTAVLMRAAEPLEGIERMRANRGRDGLRDLCSGPGKLARAFGATGAENGEDLVAGDRLWIEHAPRIATSHVATGPRVGVSVGYEQRWRFWIRDDPFVSKGRPGPLTRRR